MSIYVRNHVMKACFFEDDRHWKKPVLLFLTNDWLEVHGIGTQHALLYEAWAHCLESLGKPRCFFGKLIRSFFPALQGNLIEYVYVCCLLFDIFSPESLRYILSQYKTYKKTCEVLPVCRLLFVSS